MRDGDQILPHVHANKNITDRCEMLSGNLFVTVQIHKHIL